MGYILNDVFVTDEGDERIKFNIRKGSGSVSMHDTTSSESYALKDSNGAVVEVATAQSPVTYATPSVRMYVIEGYDDSSAGGGRHAGRADQAEC